MACSQDLSTLLLSRFCPWLNLAAATIMNTHTCVHAERLATPHHRRPAAVSDPFRGIRSSLSGGEAPRGCVEVSVGAVLLFNTSFTCQLRRCACQQGYSHFKLAVGVCFKPKCEMLGGGGVRLLGRISAHLRYLLPLR